MGVIRKQNEALTSQQLLACFEIVEEPRKGLKEVWEFVRIGFSMSLRGEEVSLASLLGMREHWEASMVHRIPHTS